jgi:alpha-tubulin suppressor-like RCC1 family protein
MNPDRTLRFPAAALLLLAAACTEGVTAPAVPAPQAVAALECRADVRAGVLDCASPDPAGGPLLAIVGGQNRNVRLTSTNAAYDSVAGVFAIDVTVQNLTADVMGDAGDGSVAGVKVFFSVLPTTTRGTGAVELSNHDGEGFFTAGAQPYFEYRARLEPGATSDARTWTWSVPNTVEGFGFTVYVSTPLTPPEGPGLAFRSISAAGENACGVTLDGEGYCWGSSGFGQIGAGPDPVVNGVVYRPTRVRNGPWDTITVADQGTCGLKDGAAWCWGTDLHGGLGTGTVTAGCGGTSDQNSGCSDVPVPAAEGFTFRRLAAGGSNRRPFLPYNRVTCGTDADGDTHCWGSDGDGTLGDGFQYPIANPSPVPVFGGHQFTYVSVGYHHSCGIDADGAAWCWGTEIAGELGHAQAQGGISPRPAPVEGGLRFTQLDAGGVHTCGVTTGGEVWCWGYNYRGQLGTDQVLGTCSNGFECGEVPVRVASEETFTQVTTGQVHTCALTAEGEVHCWGLASLAGRGPNPDNTVGCDGYLCYRTPVPVLGGERFTQVEAGREFTCAIAQVGRRVYCWGDYRGVAQGLGQPVYVPTRIVEPSA